MLGSVAGQFWGWSPLCVCGAEEEGGGGGGADVVQRASV